MLVLTHLHKDHVNGVAALMEYTDIDEIVLCPDNLDDSSEKYLAQILSSAALNNTRITYVYSDVEANVGNIHLDIFAPLSVSSGDNESCVIVIAGVDGYDMLISGDSPSSLEHELIKRHDISVSDLVVIGHHGANSSSSNEFLRAVNGSIAVISVGENNYGHPANEVIERLISNGYKVYRTDLDGTLRFKYR